MIIIGVFGFFGWVIMKEFFNFDKWEVLGLVYFWVKNFLKKVDFFDFDESKWVVKEFKFYVLIYFVVERRLDIVENDERMCIKMNVGVIKVLVEVINEFNSDREILDYFMVYISIDYVFDGISFLYKLLDEFNFLNKYGKSKLEGE